MAEPTQETAAETGTATNGEAKAEEQVPAEETTS